METICITMPQEEKDKLMQILEENNMTIDEAVDGFLRWLIRDTRAALEWWGYNTKSSMPVSNIQSFGFYHFRNVSKIFPDNIPSDRIENRAVFLLIPRKTGDIVGRFRFTVAYRNCHSVRRHIASLHHTV